MLAAPAYVSRIQPGKFQPAMRNLHIAAIMLNVGLMLELLALVPLETLTSGNNVLSILAEVVRGLFFALMYAYLHDRLLGNG